MSDSMRTYGQFLEARHLSEVLLRKHVEEGQKGKPVLYGDIQVDESFSKLALKLGYRVERIQPADHSEQPVYNAAREHSTLSHRIQGVGL